MGVFRGYDQPGNPYARGRCAWQKTHDDDYTDAFKAMCEDGAEERVPALVGPVCPHCRRLTEFSLHVSYDDGGAGAHEATVSNWAVSGAPNPADNHCKCGHAECGLRHYPVQCGPPEEQLLRIEEHRKREAGKKRKIDKQRERREVIELLSDGDDAPERERGKVVDVSGVVSLAKQGNRQEVIEVLSDDEEEPQRERGQAVDVSGVATFASRAVAHSRSVDRKRKAEKVMQEIERGGKRRAHGRALGVR